MGEQGKASGARTTRRWMGLVGLGMAVAGLVGGAVHSASPTAATVAGRSGSQVMCNPFMCGDNHNQVHV